MRYHYTTITMTDNMKCWSNSNSHSSLMQNGNAILEDHLPVSYKAKHSLTVQFTSYAPWYYPSGLKVKPHNNLHMNVQCTFILNCQNLEATKMFFIRWMGKQTLIHPDNGILFSDEKEWTIKPWKSMEKA